MRGVINSRIQKINPTSMQSTSYKEDRKEWDAEKKMKSQINTIHDKQSRIVIVEGKAPFFFTMTFNSFYES